MKEHLSGMLDKRTLNMLSMLLIHTTVMLAVTAQRESFKAEDNLTPFGIATQGPISGVNGKPENAIQPPIGNKYNLSICTQSWSTHSEIPAWWRFDFFFDTAYITDIAIYYRENYASRMNGFRLYVTNTSTISTEGYLCYADPFPAPYPNITQTITCNQLGRYIIYYDNEGSKEETIVKGGIVELCYVAINGCFKGAWGINCSNACPPKCIDQHCYPENGSCVWGCDPQNCLNNKCDKDTGACSEGCVTGWDGHFCYSSKSWLNVSIFVFNDYGQQFTDVQISQVH
ncbi:uncharacterized protein LOC127718350 isoform X1 [Mytilus californianus]|uniref:uncharacterized protein LOC127718350 isoform X1 n=2 Tax=Mytilus californianus TaxID=6549 RepID=UPI002247A833|nr:uncharacterized protein LOC127718350 isoform X1 [Mytilus californianus]